MVLNWLKEKVLGGRIAASNPVALPDDVMQTMRDLKKAHVIAPYIDWASNQENARQIVAELNAKARNLDWSQGEIAKLNTYDAYYSRRYQEAYNASVSFASGEKFDPDYFGVTCMTLFNTNQFDRAYKLLRSIKEHEHTMLGSVDYLLAASLVCWSAGDRYLANKYIDIGTRLCSEAGIMTFNALAMYFELGDMEGMRKAESLLDQTTRAHPNFQYCLAFIELSKNNYEDGLRMAESRYEMSEAHRYLRAELLAKPRWHREDISDKILLIHGEQGLGDMIQTARFFGACLESAKEVIVECPHESIAFLEYNYPAISFVPLSLEKPVSRPYDVWAGTLSLPYIYNVNCTSIPGKKGYLQVPADHRQYWRERVAEQARQGAVKIGIAWSGFPGHRADHRRSLSFGLIRPLIEQYPEVDFFAVQIKVPDDLPSNLHDCTEEMATLSDTAALIDEMDLIISVDTSIVHMAGSIGKETWMMLPHRYEWRWGLEGEENCWYDSVKVIRQPAPGAWAPVLSRVFGRRLKDFLNKASK